MKKSKTLVYISIATWTIYSFNIFIGKGMESGYQDWRFYASLIGFSIPLTFCYLMYKKVKKVKG